MADGKHIFVTVGTTRFDSLIKEISSEVTLDVLSRLGFSSVTLQIGRGDYEPKTATKRTTPHVTYFRLKDSIADDVAQADLVICHAGAGSIMDSLSAGKSVLVVINEELMGNHQIELAQKLAKEGHLHYCGVSSLVQSLESLDFSLLKSLPPGEPNKFAEHLDKILGFV